MLTKTQEANLKKYAKTTPAVDQAMMFIKGINSTAMFWFLPMIAWIEPIEVPTLFLSGALLKMGDQTYAGSASWRIPVTPGTGDAPLVVLAALGWSGQLWPDDKGWPTGFPEEEGLRQVLRKAPIYSTFSFIPDPVKGNRVLKVLISKTNGTCLQPPEVHGDDRTVPTDEMRAVFQRAVLDPSPFMPSTWQPGVRRPVAGIDFHV